MKPVARMKLEDASFSVAGQHCGLTEKVRHSGFLERKLENTPVLNNIRLLIDGFDAEPT